MSTPPDPAACPNCGALNDPTWGYCAICGRPLSRAARAEQPPTAPPHPAAASPYDYAPPSSPAMPAAFEQASNPYAPDAAPTPTTYAPPPLPAQQPGGALRRNQAPLPALGAGAVVLLCVLSVAGFAFLNPGGVTLFAPPTATPLEAGVLLDRAASAMEQVDTVHYRMLAEFNNVGGSGDGSIILEGDIAFPDSYTMHSTASGDVIVIGPDAWARPLDSQRWLPITANQAASTTTNPASLARFIRYYRSAIVESDYMSGTQRLYRLNFTIDTLELAAGEGEGSAGEALLGTDADADALIGADDHLLRELVLRISQEASSLQINIRFSNFDAPVTIAPPEDLGP